MTIPDICWVCCDDQNCYAFRYVDLHLSRSCCPLHRGSAPHSPPCQGPSRGGQGGKGCRTRPHSKGPWLFEFKGIIQSEHLSERRPTWMLSKSWSGRWECFVEPLRLHFLRRGYLWKGHKCQRLLWRNFKTQDKSDEKWLEDRKADMKLNPSEASVHFVKRIKRHWLTEDSRGNEAKSAHCSIVKRIERALGWQSTAEETGVSLIWFWLHPPTCWNVSNL